MKFIWILVFIFSLSFCAAQKIDLTYYHLSASYQSNIIIAQRVPAFRFQTDRPWAVQLDFAVLKTSSKSWSNCNCYSQNGVSLGYINFDDPSSLGHAITIAGFIEPRLVTAKRFSASVRGSAGIAFLDKVYDSATNPDNIFVSTKLSFVLGVGAMVSYKLNDQWVARAGIQFNHISNGGRKDPNDGLNFYGYNVGLQYSLRPLKAYSLAPQSNESFKDKDWSLAAHVFGNQRTIWATGTLPEETRLVLGVNLGVIKRIGRLNGVGAGAEFYYDGINAVYQQRLNREFATGIGSVSLQHYLFFGKLLFGQQLGLYLNSVTGYPNSIFQRYILEYEFKKNWYAGFTLKAHADKSDYFAFSTGYFFHLK